jgi:hypothetical protein
VQRGGVWIEPADMTYEEIIQLQVYTPTQPVYRRAKPVYRPGYEGRSGGLAGLYTDLLSLPSLSRDLLTRVTRPSNACKETSANACSGAY